MTADGNREGFRVLRSDPALFAVELLWRWSFGLGLLGLLFFAYAHLRQAVLLTDADELALSSQDPFAVAEAAAALITRALPLLLRTTLHIASWAAVFWIAAAAPGRAIVTRSIVFRLARDHGLTLAQDEPRWTTFAILHGARVLMMLILVIGYLGGALIIQFIPGAAESPATASLIMFVSLAVSSVAWSYVNWVLSLAPIFVARDALSPLDSVVAAIAFVRHNYPRLRSVALWNSTLRGSAATVLSIAGVCTVALHGALPDWAITAFLALETLAYLLISDLFLLARLGAYSAVAVRELVLPRQLLAAADNSGTVKL